MSRVVNKGILDASFLLATYSIDLHDTDKKTTKTHGFGRA